MEQYESCLNVAQGKDTPAFNEPKPNKSSIFHCSPWYTFWGAVAAIYSFYTMHELQMGSSSEYSDVCHYI